MVNSTNFAVGWHYASKFPRNLSYKILTDQYVYTCWLTFPFPFIAEEAFSFAILNRDKISIPTLFSLINIKPHHP